jgi:phage tail sheath protein FI
MPVRPTFPGVYIEEVPSGVRPITAVATSTAAFIGTFRKGLANEAVRLLSISDFERECGGLERSSDASYAVQQFFLNGGSEAWVVRIGQPGPVGAQITAITSAANGTLNSFAGAAILNFFAGRRIRGESARNPGDWGNFLRIEIDHNNASANATFSFSVSEVAIAGNRTNVLQTETFHNLTMEPDTANYAVEVINQGSRLVQVTRPSTLALNDFTPPAANGTAGANLAAAVPAIGSIDNIAATLFVGPHVPAAAMPYPLTIASSPVINTFADWETAFEDAIQAGGTDPLVPADLQPYFATATVALLGTGTPGDPHRFLIRPGTAVGAHDPAAVFTFGGTDVAAYGLDTPISATPQGTLGSDLAAVPPFAGLDDIEITLNLRAPAQGTPIALTIPSFPATSFPAWANAFQNALRDAGTSPAIRADQRAYFSGASVVLIGDGSVANPRRFVITTGQGAQPFEPDALIAFGSTGAANADAVNYGLNPPTSVRDQQFLPVAGSGADGTITDPATGNYLVPSFAFTGNPLPPKTGLYAIDDMDLVNIICIPDAPRLGAVGALSVYQEAITYAGSRRSMIIVDIPSDVVSIDQMETWLASNEPLRDPNSVVYYPRTRTPDPLNQNRPRTLSASGTIAGLWARTDVARGVWKAPAGTDARLRNVDSLTYVMTDLENGTLNPLGINCLRNFPVYSNICWGARTLHGADTLASDWKYVPVRRTTLFIEESLYRGTKWVVFEPNDEPLWSQIRLNVGAFMHDLFRKGAFQGSKPSEAYFVKCDGETTTQSDIDTGIVNIEVGFAPLKPAEFVIIKIRQIGRVTAE